MVGAEINGGDGGWSEDRGCRRCRWAGGSAAVSGGGPGLLLCCSFLWYFLPCVLGFCCPEQPPPASTPVSPWFCWLDYMSSVVVAGAGGWWGAKAVPGGAVLLDYMSLMNSVDFCFDYICWICSLTSGTFVGLICWMRAAMMKKIKTSILMTMARQGRRRVGFLNMQPLFCSLLIIV
ncbi:hypothetical protein Hdeb2414_s0713g00938651 [Helianthus debilis subsp. tardiflorus]